MRTLIVRLIVAHIVLITTSVCIRSHSYAQEYKATTAADTSSPRDTLKSFLDACNEFNELIRERKYFDRDAPEYTNLGMRVIDCLDTSELPDFERNERAGEVAVCLKEILDREEISPWELIPDLEKIESKGGFEELSRWRIPGTRITIARIEEGPQKHEYLFTSGTVTRAVDYYKQVESKPYRTGGPKVSEDFYIWYVSSPGEPNLAKIVERLPMWMQTGRTLGLANWKWPGLLISLVIGIALMVTIYSMYGPLAQRARESSVLKYCLTLAFPIIATLIPLAFLYVCANYLTVRGTALYVTSFFANIVALFAGLFLLFATSSRVAEAIISSPRINPQGLNAQLIRIVSRLASLAASVGLILVGGEYLGIPLNTLLASAGIGGVALALGAQDTLKTLFGTLALMADKPFRVGDRIAFAEYDGVVEDIGLRSTRVRLLTGHLVTFPNDQMANGDIENIGLRPFIRRKAEIHIPLDTSCEKVEQAVEIIRALLDNHEGMDEAHPPRVFFNEFNSDAFSITFIYWYSPPNYWEFKAFGEKLNFKIFQDFEEHGIQFSLPLRHSYWKHDDEQGPLDVQVSGDGQ
ncbi:MAG: mechanosensitive ion channel family protein [Pirellulales bacterium]